MTALERRQLIRTIARLGLGARRRAETLVEHGAELRDEALLARARGLLAALEDRLAAALRLEDQLFEPPVDLEAGRALDAEMAHLVVTLRTLEGDLTQTVLRELSA